LSTLASEINKGQSFTYVVARKGTTGKATDFSTEMDDYLAKIKTDVKKPVGVGFGIASRDDVQFLAGKADMAIIGSKVLKIVEEEGVEKVGPFLSSLR
jgi:tryptophan synthase alpha chain